VIGMRGPSPRMTTRVSPLWLELHDILLLLADIERHYVAGFAQRQLD
jgi:hypothetical protein